MSEDDWRKWKNGKYDDRYRGVKRHSGQRSYLKIIAIIIPISIIIILAFVIPSQAIGDFINKSIPSLSKSINTNLISSDQLQSMTNKVLTEDNYYAQLVPSNLQVVDKGRYNVISFSVNVNVQDLPIDGSVYFEDLYTTIQDENSKIYHPDSSECSLNDLIPILGKESDKGTYNVCYSVDKSLKAFSIFYTEPSNNYHSYRLGHLSVDSDLFKYYESHYTSQPIQIGKINLGS